MARKIKLFSCCAAYVAITLVTGAVAPQDLCVKRISYHKMTISWQAPDTTTQIAGYKIYRDGIEIATTTSLNYTDESVNPGTQYRYKVLAALVGGGYSDFSSEVTAQALKSANFDNNNIVEQVVDAFHETPASNINALSLISACKASLETLLGSSVFFSVVDEGIINSMVAEELALINTVAPELTEAEKLAAQAEIDTIMTSAFSGNSFDHVYINQKLTELGEKHWNAGNKIAAEIFYEFSLNYLSNNESAVATTLCRLAHFAKCHLNQASSNADISASLSKAKSHWDRYFDFFSDPASNSQHAKDALLQPLGWYFSFFPKMLDYSSYDADFFSVALESSKRLLALDPTDPYAIKRLEKIAAWELINLQLRFVDENGNPRTGSIKVKNISAENGKEYLFFGTPYIDEREFVLSEGIATVPVYAGHDYSVSLNVNVNNGAQLNFDLPELKYEKGKLISYNYLSETFTESPSSQPIVDFVVSSAAHPYNLSVDRGIDVFDLSWNWSAPDGFITSCFKVYCGTNEIASVSTQSVRIPLNNATNEFSYRVIAYDNNGSASLPSKTIYVYPGDQSQYVDFFEWMASYFGESTVYASDDPDEDGVDNYHEFLNGTDPTKKTGPTPYAGPRGFNELTVEWDAVTENSDAIYQISRNGNIIGTIQGTKYVDTNLVPGLLYTYKIRLLSPAAFSTDWSLPNTLSTQRPHNYEHANQVQQVVEQFLNLNISEYTGQTLISAVKGSMEALTGTTISFSTINDELLEELVDQELGLLQSVTPVLTATERIIARDELNSIMQEYWGSNSFEEMYINDKLTELAEKHWQKYIAEKNSIVNKNAAKELFEASLFFLKDHETTVRNTIARLSLLEVQALDGESTNSEIKNALTNLRDTALRIYDYFPEPSEEDSNPYKSIISNYRKFFPRLLSYSNYDNELFENILQVAAVYRDQDVTDVFRVKLYENIATWKLSQLLVSCNVNNGNITLRDATPNLPTLPWPDDTSDNNKTRTFPLSGENFYVPVYAGHLYDITITIPVNGGADWVREIHGVKFGSNLKITDNPFQGLIIEDIENPDGSSEFIFPINSVTFPYNLTCQKFPDSFTLSWQYVPLPGTTVDHYNIYRGNTLVKTSTGMTCTEIPRSVYSDGVYNYSISAVDESGNESDRSPVLQVLPDFTEEELKYFEWKQKYFGDTPVLATDDNDLDGLTNYQEFLLGSNPTVSANNIDLSNLTGKTAGAKINYYKAPNMAMPDFANTLPFKSEIRNDFCFSSTTNNVLNSGKAEQVAMTVDGFFDVAADGYYSFIIKSDDGMRLFVNGVEILSHSLVDNPREQATTIFLKSGINSFHVQYFNYRNAAELQILWGAKGELIKDFSTEAIWHMENVPPELQEYIAMRKDSDCDQLSDMEEILYGTSPTNADSDGDGLSDYEEVKVHFTNPNNPDTNSNGIPDSEETKLSANSIDLNNIFFALQNEINGSDYTDSIGVWEKLSNAAHAAERRGALTYNFVAETANIYKMEFSFSSAYNTGNNNPFDIYIDNKYVTTSIQQLTQATKDFSVLTPYLTEGSHTVTIHWDNHRLTEDLLIEKLKIYSISSLAAENRTVNSSDEIEHSAAEKIVAARNHVDETITSPVSPFCLTGRSEFPGLTLVNSESAVVYGANNWMKNVELNAAAPVSASISFENGAVNKLVTITWQPTDIIAENNQTLTIRRGDSLLFTAKADGAATWVASGDGISLSAETGKNQSYKFNSAGEFVITAKCLNAVGDNIETGKITVKVVDYNFKRDNVICIVNYGREWNINSIPDMVQIKTDERYKAAFVDTAASANPYLKVFVDDNKERYNYASVQTQGREAIIAVQKIQGVEVFSSNFTGIRQVDSTDDLVIGDDIKVYNMKIVVSPVRPDIEFRINIFVAGVTFDDGTVVRIIPSSDFNANGMCSVDFVRPNEVDTSICHKVMAYQNDEYIGTRLK